jgi:hypothetical protein
MEPVTLTAATIATLLFSEAIKEGGKSLGSAVSKVLGQLMAITLQRRDRTIESPRNRCATQISHLWSRHCLLDH